jgi:hypothetical protein
LGALCSARSEQMEPVELVAPACNVSSSFNLLKAVEVEWFDTEASEGFCAGKGDESEAGRELAVTEVNGDLV